MKPSTHRLFHSLRCLQHENPLGLPRAGTIPRMQRGLPEKRKIKDVAKVIAVSSAKGGVGKSTIAANLTLAFARQGYRAGILDTDLFGPSIPALFNLSGEPRLSQTDNLLLPLSNYGVKTMSMGYLAGATAPIAWRGLMVMKALQQLLFSVDWGGPGLDVLVLDLPPGTGDTQLTLTQSVVLDGALVVTTPHALALADATRGMRLFRTAGCPLLGVVQNMSLFRCPHCAGATRVFGAEEGVQALCAEHDVPLLGDVPLHPRIGEDAHAGRPTVVAEPEGEQARVFLDIATKVAEGVGLRRGGEGGG